MVLIKVSKTVLFWLYILKWWFSTKNKTFLVFISSQMHVGNFFDKACCFYGHDVSYNVHLVILNTASEKKKRILVGSAVFED